MMSAQPDIYCERCGFDVARFFDGEALCWGCYRKGNRPQPEPSKAPKIPEWTPEPNPIVYEKWFERMRSVLPLLAKENGMVCTVFMAIFSHLKQDGTWAISQPEIAAEVRCSERTVGRAIRRLRELGIFETEQPGFHLRTKFRFVYIEPPF